MNLITIIEIATNYPNGDILIETYKDKKYKKYGAHMYLMRNGNYHKTMLSFNLTDEFKGFDSSKKAKEAMNEYVEFAVNHYKDKIQSK